jgi:phosphate transport system permease protein
MLKSKRQIKEILSKSIVYLLGSVGMLVLAAIIFYVTTTGLKLVSIDMILGDSRDLNTDVSLTVPPNYYELDDIEDDWFYSFAWGIAIKDDIDREGNPVVRIVYLHPDSPFQEALDRNNFDEDGNHQIVKVREGTVIEKVFFENNKLSLARFGAEAMHQQFENAEMIREMTIQMRGGGIRGSLITTLWMILLTLMLAIPIGVSTAVFFNEFARNNKATNIIRNMVDLLTGVPSIIYGMMGAAVFIPLLNNTINTSGGSVISGALTLAVILLPVIIKNTEEALKVIHDDLRRGSLALGANKTQTLFKVVLPNALPGILTGVLLGIGRIIGESAALIFAVGAAIKDDIILTERSTTLATHIWTIMGGEKPNFELAAAISIIILIVVFIINFIVKIIARNLQKAWQ